MTREADTLRDRRRAYALPGTAHDRTLKVLNQLLPAAVGMIVAVMIISPLFPRSEVSFLLDRNKVAITKERLKVSNAQYRGADNEGRPFAVNAGQAVQKSARVPVVDMSDLKAQIQLHDGPAQVVANQGSYDIQADRMLVKGQVNFTAADGYRMQTNNVTVDLKTRKAHGEGGVSGAIPAGTFTANTINADLTNRTVSLDGRAHLRMVPGKMRTP